MKRKIKQNKKVKKFNPIWIPRILIILYTIFISLFALDTDFGIGLLVHLLPTIILLTILILTWKMPKLAGILFILSGIGTVIVWNTYRDLVLFFIFSVSLVLFGILFCILARKEKLFSKKKK